MVSAVAYAVAVGIMVLLLIVGIAIPQMRGEIVGSLSVEVTLWKVTTCSLVTGICDETGVKNLCSAASTRLQGSAGCCIIAIITTIIGCLLVFYAPREDPWEAGETKPRYVVFAGFAVEGLGLLFSLTAWALSANVYHANFCSGAGVNSATSVGFKDLFNVPGGSSSYGAGFALLVVSWIFLLLADLTFLIWERRRKSVVRNAKAQVLGHIGAPPPGKYAMADSSTTPQPGSARNRDGEFDDVV